MVISDKYKYVFVELPLTGSTAISNELCEIYEGKKILRKHSKYQEFLEIASEEQKKYFVFSGIRNPMDLVVSEFLKKKNNHKQRYTTPSEWRKNGGTLSDKEIRLYKEIQEKNMCFQDYFKKYFKLPYDNWSAVAHKDFDFIIRFENLTSDFNFALKKLKIESVRQLPQINKTSAKEDYIKYYTPEIREKVVFVFQPFMKKWNYDFPAEWNVKRNNHYSFVLYKLLSIAKKFYWRATKSKSAPAVAKENK
jgi:sulfotransferase famil protein